MTSPHVIQPAQTAPVSVGGIVLALLSVPAGFLGVAWIVVFYLTAGSLPIAALGVWNLLLGLVLWLPSLPMLIAGIVLIVRARHR
jgi:hypothetical protein